MQKQHSLLTHGHTTWAHNALTHLGIRDCFEDHHIIGIEQLDFCLKDKSTKPFEYLLKKMDALPHKTAMVEDLPENLKFAKELGITTIHMVYDAEEPSPDWVDTRVSSPKELLKILA